MDSNEISQSSETRQKVKDLPFSMDGKKLVSRARTNTLFHLGAMDWKLNSDGIFWFLNEVWPKVHNEIPDTELHLGGKDIDLFENKLKGDGIVVHNKVKNAGEFYEKYNIMIVPVHSASGLRIKIVQALAAGKAIVSTKTGLTGMPGRAGEHYIISNDSKEMSTSIINLLKDELKQEHLSKNAAHLFTSTFESKIVAKTLKELLNN